ncbi:unnamed protein product [Moneuplotes crassus]|uniref:Uncharacterized protein n=1 Tax=Euplotes crassus TaxID=5936 RepID=A0AAD1XNX8_EUPCR|nr:unnamed protein product [Moneuplotes crassus]
MAESRLNLAIHEANRIYNVAESEKREGDVEEAVEFYKKACEAYLGVVKVCESEGSDDLELKKRMKVFAESCKREVEIFNLREDLLNDYGESSQGNSSIFGDLKSSFCNYTVVSESMFHNDLDENSKNNQEELSRVKLKLETMKGKIIKRLDSLEKAFLKLESLYNEDIRSALADPTLTIEDLNLKRVDKCMTDLKKYIDKVADSASSDFKSEISQLNSSIHGSSLKSSLMVKGNQALIEEESVDIEGLPPGITVDEMKHYLAQKNPPLFVTFEKYIGCVNLLEEAKEKFNKKKEQLESLRKKHNRLIQEIEKLKN